MQHRFLVTIAFREDASLYGINDLKILEVCALKSFGWSITIDSARWVRWIEYIAAHHSVMARYQAVSRNYGVVSGVINRVSRQDPHWYCDCERTITADDPLCDISADYPIDTGILSQPLPTYYRTQFQLPPSSNQPIDTGIPSQPLPTHPISAASFINTSCSALLEAGCRYHYLSTLPSCDQFGIWRRPGTYDMVSPGRSNCGNRQARANCRYCTRDDMDETDHGFGYPGEFCCGMLPYIAAYWSQLRCRCSQHHASPALRSFYGQCLGLMSSSAILAQISGVGYLHQSCVMTSLAFHPSSESYCKMAHSPIHATRPDVNVLNYLLSVQRWAITLTSVGRNFLIPPILRL